MSAMMKILIEEKTKVRRLLGPTEVWVTSTVEVGTVGIMGFAVTLDPLGMSVTARQNNI